MGMDWIERARGFSRRIAIASDSGDYSYQSLIDASGRVAGGLTSLTRDLEGERVAFLVPPGFEYPAVQWGVWRVGAIAVPLCLSHPEPELEYVVDDCGPGILAASPELLPRLEPIARRRGLKLVDTQKLLLGPATNLRVSEPDWPAMIVYTSGTTGGPKGVVTTHRNIEAQVTSLIEAWAWEPEDRILLTLPLHHVHGIINVLGCALWCGATCETMVRFDAEEVWSRFETSPLTLFMAVPTIYSRLETAWRQAPPEIRQRWSLATRRLRLMVSGSAALPERLFAAWREISGHALLERYGMTEIGMALSNPLVGERRPGHVGQPLPGVEVRRRDGGVEVDDPATPGELEVRGPNVFREYWQRPDATRAAFDGGWFQTGDIAVVDQGSFRILGRSSVDIIKTGGYKVSALEVEEVLREHPEIADCAVVGLPDEEWGERVAVVVVVERSAQLALAALRGWAKERLAPYKVPSRLLQVEEMPRNAMGKITKPEVKALLLEAVDSAPD